MSVVVYWLYDENCTDPFLHGYIGITNNIRRRMADHRYKRRLPFKYKILFRGTREECISLEKKMRPSAFIGWNIFEGGGDPPHYCGANNHFFGKKHSEETKIKMSLAAKRRKKASHAIPHSEHTKKLISEKLQALPRDTCPHCHKSVLKHYKRFHWENCKNVQSR